MLGLLSVEVYHYSVSHESNWGLTITTWNDTADLVNETTRKNHMYFIFSALVNFKSNLNDQPTKNIIDEIVMENFYLIYYISLSI